MFAIFSILPLLGFTALLFILWMIVGKSYLLKFILFLWGGLFIFILLISFISWLKAKTVLDKQDYYGEYVINRDYFKGIQADWQYNHFRFEITKEDSIFFYQTEGEKIIKTYRGTISTKLPYRSARLEINMDLPKHHILTYNPTTYRSSWDFYLVFYSPKFNNLFFKKGIWRPIN